MKRTGSHLRGRKLFYFSGFRFLNNICPGKTPKNNSPKTLKSTNWNPTTTDQTRSLEQALAGSSTRRKKSKTPIIGEWAVKCKVLPTKRTVVKSHRGFTTKTRQQRGVMSDNQKVIPPRKKENNFIQTQNFTNKNSSSHSNQVAEMEKEISQLNIQVSANLFISSFSKILKNISGRHIQRQQEQQPEQTRKRAATPPKHRTERLQTIQLHETEVLTRNQHPFSSSEL